MNCLELNKNNKKYMKSEMNNSLNFEWEDNTLLNDLLKRIDIIYPSISDPEEFRNDKKYLNDINNLFSELYSRKINNEIFIKRLNDILKRLIKEYPDLSYYYKYNIDTYKRIISNSNRLLINGCAGIGKSYFLCKLEDELSELGVDHLCIYGKYNKSIPREVLDEINNKKDEFYLIIDAINEFEIDEQKNIITYLKKISLKKNINIIVSYRNLSLNEENYNELNILFKNKYEFRGVDFESSLLILIERYGLEVVRYLDIIESNNPLYLKMLNKILNSGKLKQESINGLVQITFIMEQYIQEMCGKQNWIYVKEIGKKMLSNEETSISEDDLRLIVNKDYDSFVKSIIEHDFMYMGNYNKKKYFGFKIQQLADFIIARPLFDEISPKSEDEIIELINKKINKIYTLHEAITILLFEKYKTKEIEKALRIFVKSELHKEVPLDVFRKINLNLIQISTVQKFFRITYDSSIYWMLGGFPNRPFNCKNFINKYFLENNSYDLNVIERFREPDYILHLKNILYSLPYLDNQLEFVEEYFYYAFWLMSSSNERIRTLSVKIVYDLSYKNPELRKKLIHMYKRINDFYIKKGIIYVLTMLPRDKYIQKKLKALLKDRYELDAENVFRLARYFGKEQDIPNIHKYNINRSLSNSIAVDEKLNLKRIISLADIYEKYLLKFERYPKEENTLSLYENFIINNSKKVKQYNRKLLRKFKCVSDNGYCKYSIGGGYLQEKIKSIKINEFDSKRMFVLYQETLKKIAELYNYNLYQDEKFDIHINKFGDSKLKKILLVSQDILLGSLMSNYYTKEFSVYNDEKTFGYVAYKYIMYDEEKFYLTIPVCPYNELVDQLNQKKCEEIKLYDERTKEWYDNVDNSIETCSILAKPIELKKEQWSLIGGSVQRFIPHELNESYSCYMGFNPTNELIGDENSRYFTIENEYYYGNLDNYKYVDNFKCMKIQNFQSNSKDIKESNLMFPAPNLIKYLNLSFDFKTSSWVDEKKAPIIMCDNNPKNYFKYPISGAIYIKTSVLEKLKKNNRILYWCYTEKLFREYGFNENASLHIELNENGVPQKIFNDRKLTSIDRTPNIKCQKCRYGIYQKEK